MTNSRKMVIVKFSHNIQSVKFIPVTDIRDVGVFFGNSPRLHHRVPSRTFCRTRSVIVAWKFIRISRTNETKEYYLCFAPQCAGGYLSMLCVRNELCRIDSLRNEPAPKEFIFDLRYKVASLPSGGDKKAGEGEMLQRL